MMLPHNWFNETIKLTSLAAGASAILTPVFCFAIQRDIEEDWDTPEEISLTVSMHALAAGAILLAVFMRHHLFGPANITGNTMERRALLLSQTMAFFVAAFISSVMITEQFDFLEMDLGFVDSSPLERDALFAGIAATAPVLFKVAKGVSTAAALSCGAGREDTAGSDYLTNSNGPGSAKR